MFVTNSFLFHKTLRLAAGGGAYALAGVPVDIRRLNALSAVRRTYAVAGQSAALRKASRIGLVTGTYAAAGKPVLLRRQLKLSANPATLAMAGQSAGLQKSRVSGFVKTDFAIAGQSVSLKRQLRLAVTATGMSAAFQNVGLLKVAGRVDVIGADATLVGLDVQMALARKLGSSLATLSVATQQVNLRRNYPIAAQTSVFALAGVSIGMRASKRLSVVKAGFSLAGQQIALSASVSGLTFITSANGSAAGAVVPATALAGDLVVIYYAARNTGAGSSPALVEPAGWSRCAGGAGGASQTRIEIFAKIISSGDIGATVTGPSGTDYSRYAVAVFRPARSLASLVANEGQATNVSGTPATTTVTASSKGSSELVLVLAAFISSAGFTETMTPSMTAVTAVNTNHRPKYTIYNPGSTKSDHSIGMPDTGASNGLALVYLTFVPA